ncbi:MAG: HTH domain-containing protein [Bacteroidales bacterium]
MVELIRNLPGINSRRIKDELSVSQRTVERLIKQLREEGKIKFKGSAKTGGYFIVENKTL